MPWQECTVMEQRREFVALATQAGANMRELCRRFGISPTTGYTLLHRAAVDGSAALADQSRRPHTSPHQTHPAVAAVVCAIRQRHDTWGGRKIHHSLRRHHFPGVPAPSTITAILKRAGLLVPDARAPTAAFIRFEHAQPNDLWQMDFLGYHQVRQDGEVHPLVIIDDHSRALLAVVAAPNEQWETVHPVLQACFRRYGLPRAILTDNGPSWGRGGRREWSQCEVWLTRLGVALWHGRPYHPQTQGTVERLNRTINADVFGPRTFVDRAQAQVAFDAFRTIYNQDRPHESLDYAVPVDRYQASARSYPAELPAITYADDAQVRTVADNGTISFAGYRIQAGGALRGLPVGVVATATAGQFRVQFCHRHLGTIDLTRLDKTATRCPLCP